MPIVMRKKQDRAYFVADDATEIEANDGYAPDENNAITLQELADDYFSN